MDSRRVTTTDAAVRPMDAGSAAPLDVARIRADFPILATRVRGKPLVYLDSAASSQKPNVVINAGAQFYREANANIHRGVHYLSEVATQRFDETRAAAQRFLGAKHAHEVIFTRGTTEGVNLVAASFGQAFVKAGDEIVLSEMEHHSNIVPWQLLAQRAGAVIRVIPVTDDGQLDLAAFERLLSPRTRVVAVAAVSNALGTVNDLPTIATLAHAAGAVLFVDGAQAAPHTAVDVQALGCDFFVCSGHKMLGPTGVGLLYGAERWLEQMPPWQGGGDMIETVSFEGTTFAKLPAKFEAGTPDIAAIAAYRHAFEYLERVGLERVAAHERALVEYATVQLAAVPGIRIIGTAPHKAGVLSFVMDGVHPHDIGTILDREGIAVRAGHHCAQPLMRRFGVPSTVRASFYLYNTHEEVDALVRGLESVRSIFH